MRFWELSNKDVINCKNGHRLGCVGDLELMYVNYVSQISMFLQEEILRLSWQKSEYKIPVGAVIRIGVDSILVDIDEKKCLVK